ncbi:helix-turn-helix domain-containing protein [Enterococcus casseliflavus]|uniref:helix-turn-helix domain-containing protein n=1 Tax=Enterococcus casseliflavus TaxID=37734 RepID=UPI001158D1B4|nr:helix-turn-helix transcriptional regulator [Enterococcus casseliflavus]
MNTYEIIKDLSRQKKISIRQLEMMFGYSNGYLAKWKNNTPNSEELVRLADYFHVSVDYLLGRTQEPNEATDQPSMAKQVMMRMDTTGASKEELEELESEMERFFAWRLEEIKRERREN